VKIVECGESQLRRDFMPLIIDLWAGEKFAAANRQHVEWLDKKIRVTFADFSIALAAYTDEGKPIGFIWYKHDIGMDSVSYSGKFSNIIQIGVYEDYQRQGIGTALVKEACRRIKESGGECLYTDTYANDNDQPMMFYIKNKFIPIAYHMGLNGTNDFGQVYFCKTID
jgi:ribosomal protein S18 acetylase RimI-like enzyme